MLWLSIQAQQRNELNKAQNDVTIWSLTNTNTLNLPKVAMKTNTTLSNLKELMDVNGARPTGAKST